MFFKVLFESVPQRDDPENRTDNGQYDVRQQEDGVINFDVVRAPKARIADKYGP
ncbi:MAG TPA: hypothetical protein VFD80_08810 [Flavobacteriaceae bacterium]|nr:hypothetical protein [Flavobacteriaceae bacterium]